ncbi:MAG TPA: ribonuclease III [Candidatus Sulfotelmatobacter sp.]|jgi:ribonuclease-3|nr:ribonuclease III [Candidatus Sulfotelmatobacter sp.]
MDERLQKISKALDYRFRRIDLLDDALTHPGASQPRLSKRRVAYERLEFLGDRVLGLVVAEMLFNRFPNEKEGDLARRHAALVKGETVAVVAGQLGLGEALIIAKSEDAPQATATPTMLADACEAVLGAMYADSGLEDAARIVRRFWEPLMDQAATPPRDPKTALQEWAQGRGKPLPVYETIGSEGPAHQPHFIVRVSVAGLEPVTATGTSKRAAEKAAATAMLEKVT